MDYREFSDDKLTGLLFAEGDSLPRAAADQTNGWFVRAVAIEGLGLIACRNPETKKEIRKRQKIKVYHQGIF